METAHSVSGHSFPAQVVFGLFDIIFPITFVNI